MRGPSVGSPIAEDASAPTDAEANPDGASLDAGAAEISPVAISAPTGATKFGSAVR